MVQEKYGVRLATQEKGRLRKMIRAGRSSAQADYPGPHPDQDR